MNLCIGTIVSVYSKRLELIALKPNLFACQPFVFELTPYLIVRRACGRMLKPMMLCQEIYRLMIGIIVSAADSAAVRGFIPFVFERFGYRTIACPIERHKINSRLK